jgi:16S rRNA (guanine(966)-N(2))-methyltransferase RsmD
LALIIIAGLKKGLKLETPAREVSRPTASRVREALFSMIGDAVPGSTALDLYAGSGSMGLEAASRGARRTVLCDRDPQAVEVLTRNASRFPPAFDITVLRATSPDRLSALKRLGPFDLILLDPPYADTETPSAFLRAAPSMGLVAPRATVVWEMSPRNLRKFPETFPEPLPGEPPGDSPRDSPQDVLDDILEAGPEKKPVPGPGAPPVTGSGIYRTVKTRSWGTRAAAILLYEE